jgi:NAD(P) transhydrogenase
MLTLFVSLLTRALRLLGVHILGDIASELIALGQATLYNSGTIDVFNNLTVATPTYTMAYKYAAFDGFKRLAATGVSLQTFESEQK